jgi:hypothetical protein
MHGPALGALIFSARGSNVEAASAGRRHSGLNRRGSALYPLARVDNSRQMLHRSEYGCGSRWL